VSAADSFAEEIAAAVADKLKRYAVSRRVMSLEEAADYLGLTPTALRHKASCGDVPTIRFDKHLRFDRFSLDEWIEQHKSSAA
jgi:excisionase family DNA binding protein